MKINAVALFFALVTLTGLSGCATKDVAVATPPVAGTTSQEAEKPTLDKAEAQRQIDTVLKDKSVPESLKPEIIAQIKHNAGLK